jgi:sugar-specific transcriptional regulator TrmB
MSIRNGGALVQQLVGLGLNELEARAYIALAASGPTTAYQLAKSIHKPTANVYKAVNSLAAKGAAAVQAGEKRVVNVIPPAEFVGRLRRQFAELADAAIEGLAAIHSAPDTDQLYSLENVDAVLERARSMLATARTIAVVDAFPRILACLDESVRRAVSRKVKVFVQAYSPTRLAASSVVLAAKADRILARWNCEFLILVVDGEQVLFAVCRSDLSDVIQAYWSNSLFLSCVQHAGQLREHLYHQLHDLVAAGQATPEKLKRLLDEQPTFGKLPAPGEQALHSLIARTAGERAIDSNSAGRPTDRLRPSPPRRRPQRPSRRKP